MRRCGLRRVFDCSRNHLKYRKHVCHNGQVNNSNNLQLKRCICRQTTGAAGPTGPTGATGPTGPTISQTFTNPSRALNSSFQISSTRNANVSYAVDITCTATLIGGQTGTITLQYADDSGITTNVVSLPGGQASNSVSLAIALTAVNSGTVNLHGVIPAGKWVKIGSSGTATMAIRAAQQEALQ